MFGHLNVDVAGPAMPSATSRKRRRQRQAVDGQKARDAAAGSSAGGGAQRGRADGASLWDVRAPVPAPHKVPPAPSRRGAPAIERRPHGPARPQQYTVVDGKIVKLGGGADAARPRTHEPLDTKRTKGEVFVPTGEGILSVQDLEKNRLSVEEIRQLPRFASYEEGSPSAVLYVKNLDGAVTEDDLAAVFGCFRADGGPSPTLRLCGGRMRGQAFVTFTTEAEAAAALRATNGYVLRGKPIIVQYGRKQGP
ncbi:uncharacterized protein LOC113203128 [Frankliniella occidentalis]|uniref:Uncharacterized protein LOC113203128 n=1 Tax=Frankliniella occidentalis TaxID=133901 RepID=A0A9C6XAT3_FRAOC|nr:uncharacterized protein LOC113203128 [Frankliniella occidentalis]